MGNVNSTGTSGRPKSKEFQNKLTQDYPKVETNQYPVPNSDITEVNQYPIQKIYETQQFNTQQNQNNRNSQNLEFNNPKLKIQIQSFSTQTPTENFEVYVPQIDPNLYNSNYTEKNTEPVTNQRYSGTQNFNPQVPQIDENFQNSFTQNVSQTNFQSMNQNLNQNVTENLNQNMSQNMNMNQNMNQSNFQNNIQNNVQNNSQNNYQNSQSYNQIYNQNTSQNTQSYNQIYNQNTSNNTQNNIQSYNQNYNQNSQNNLQSFQSNPQILYQPSNMYSKDYQRENPKQIQVYRFVGTYPHYKYYMSSQVSHPSDYKQDGANWESFKGFNSFFQGSVAIHRYKYAPDPSRGYCYLTPDKHTISQWVDDGLICYLFKNQEVGTKPIFRQAKENPWREILNSVSSEEGGWKNQEIIGYGYVNVTNSTNYQKKIPIYRYISQTPHYKYLITNTPSIPSQFNFYVEDGNGVSFMGLEKYESGTIPIHRYICTSHIGQGYCYLTPKKLVNPQQWRDEGLICYLYDTQRTGTIPIYRQATSSPWRELLNVTGVESGGWKNQEIIGYAYKK